MRVLTYHGVIDRSVDETSFSYLFTDIADFEEQARLLSRRARLVSLAEIERSIRDSTALPDDSVHVSFDDGYRNNFDAAEILERHRVPWSLFVIVDAVLDGYEPWFLRLANAVWMTPNVTLADGTRIELGSIAAKQGFAKRAKTEILSAPHADQDGVLDRILSLPGMRTPEETHWPLLTVGELRQLHQRGVEVGNHSARHRNLRRCSDEDLRLEVDGSRERLSDALDAPVRYFAYPDGRHDGRTRRAVDAGHALGLATWTARPPATRLAIRRYEPVDVSELGAILDRPEPWYGKRYVRRTMPWRVRELAMTLLPSRRRLGVTTT